MRQRCIRVTGLDMKTSSRLLVSVTLYCLLIIRASMIMTSRTDCITINHGKLHFLISGADQRDCVANMEYYLVLNYHPRGSLYDFLQDAQLTVQVGNSLSF